MATVDMTNLIKGNYYDHDYYVIDNVAHVLKTPFPSGFKMGLRCLVDGAGVEYPIKKYTRTQKRTYFDSKGKAALGA